MKFKTFKSHYWSINLPNDWSCQQDEECSSIFSDQGVGVLQISAYKKNEEVIDKDLYDFADEHIKSDTKVEMVHLGLFSGFNFSFVQDDQFWQHWYLRLGIVFLFVTYNCSIEDKGIEDNTVNNILNSLCTENNSE